MGWVPTAPGASVYLNTISASIIGNWDAIKDGTGGFTLRIQRGTSMPTPSGDGHVFYRTDEDKFYIYDGAAWDHVGRGLSCDDLVAGATYVRTQNDYSDTDKAIVDAALAMRAGDWLVSSNTNTPTGWTEVTATYNGKFIRISTGTALGTSGANAHTHGVGTLDIGGGVTGSHALSVAELASHRHTGFEALTDGGTGSNSRYPTTPYNTAVGTDAEKWVNTFNDGAQRTAATGGDGGHTHSAIISGDTASADNLPAYVQVKIYQKD